jgi:hypothetical protein
VKYNKKFENDVVLGDPYLLMCYLKLLESIFQRRVYYIFILIGICEWEAVTVVQYFALL